MPILESQTPYWLVIITMLGSAFISSIAGLIIAFKVEKKKIRPQITPHECRISNLQVYTYFDENNKLSAPICPYISRNGKNKCCCAIKDDDEKKDEKKKMLKINNNICYFIR